MGSNRPIRGSDVVLSSKQIRRYLAAIADRQRALSVEADRNLAVDIKSG